MSVKFSRIWVMFISALLFAACNFPTPTAEPSTEAVEIPLTEPTLPPSEIPADPTATSEATEEVEIVSTVPIERGLRVVYTDDGNLWAIEQGTPPRQLTDSGGISDVRLSYDGELIAFVVRNPDQDTAELHSIRFDGGSPQVLMDASGFDALYPLELFLHYTISKLDFLPDSYSLLFNTRGVFEGPGLAKNDDLLAIDVSTGQISPLLPRGEGGDFTVSPVGERIAVVRPDSLSFVDANGADHRPDVLTFAPIITYSEYFFYPLPVWSGPAVVLPVPQEDPFFAAEPGTIWNVNGEREILARPEGDLFAPQREFPIASPDGSKVAYFRNTDVAGEQHLVIDRIDSGERIIYDSGPLQWGGWAPDSNRMAYSKGTGLDLFLGELGSAPIPIGSGSSLRWINADEYVYLAGVPGSWTLTLVDLAGVSTPLASPVGDFVVFDFAE